MPQVCLFGWFFKIKATICQVANINERGYISDTTSYPVAAAGSIVVSDVVHAIPSAL